jgi:hypothetical protein
LGALTFCSELKSKSYSFQGDNMRRTIRHITMSLSILFLAVLSISAATISLREGWNLISLPVQPANASPSAVLSSIASNVQAVYAFNGTEYEAYIPGESSNTLTRIEAGRGYWVYMNGDGTLNIDGAEPSKTVTLKTGWNLVGYNSGSSLPVSSALNSIANKYSAIYAFDTAANSYTAYIPGDGGTLSQLEPGRGYWIYATENATWTLPQSTTPPVTPPDGGGKPVPLAVSKVADGSYPDIIVDAAGNVHIVYVRDTVLYYKKYNISNGSWGNEEDTGVKTNNAYRSDPEIVIDSQQRPHVFAGNAYSFWNGSSWTASVINVVRDTAMAIDSKDNIYIVRRAGHGNGYMGLLKKLANSSTFTPMPDPDVANGLPKGGPSDHVYPHIVVSPVDDSLHIFYRHGAPTRFAYRTSRDGGQNWAGGGISGVSGEAPSGWAAKDGSIYGISAVGDVHKRQGNGPFTWQSLGKAVAAVDRDLPVAVTDASNNLYVTSFGGRYNVRSGNSWKGEKRLPALSGKKLGFAEAFGSSTDLVYVIWEEGDTVNNDVRAGTSDLLFATIRSDGTVGK